MAETKTSNNKTTKEDYISSVNKNTFKDVESSIDGSMRLFGLPHQFTAETDPRIGSKSNLGRCFAERIALEAPIICLKPGLPDFLPNKSNKEKQDFVSAMIDASTGSLKDLINTLSIKDEDDAGPYYSIKDSYSEMMAKVNVLCKMMAVFLGLADEPVPWAKGATFGNYDWRYYSFKNVYNDSM